MQRQGEAVKKTKGPVSDADNTAKKNSSVAREWRKRRGAEEKHSENRVKVSAQPSNSATVPA